MMRSERCRQRREGTRRRDVLGTIGWLGLIIVLLSSSASAQIALLDFRFDPYAMAPVAEFRFSEPPQKIEYADTEGKYAVLRIECPGAVNRATEADYQRRYPASAPVRRLSVAQKTRDGKPVLVIRAILRSGWTVKVGNGNDPRTMRLAFSNASIGESKGLPAETSDEGAVFLVPTEETSTSPTPVAGNVRKGFGRRGTFFFVVMLVLGGFLLGWGWTTFRHRGPRPEVVSPLKLQRMSEEVHQLLDGLEREASARLDAATSRQRAFTETVQQDMRRIREELLAIADEFERATQGVLLFGEPPTTETSSAERPIAAASTDRAEEADRAEEGSASPLFAPPEGDRRRSIQEWVSRVSEQIAADRYAGTQAASLAERMRDVSETTAPEPEVSRERSRPTPRPSAEAYVRARQMIEEGKTPLEIARETQISLGEVELLARLGRLETDEDGDRRET